MVLSEIRCTNVQEEGKGKNGAGCSVSHCSHFVNVYGINSRFWAQAEAPWDQQMPSRRGFSEERHPCHCFPDCFGFCSIFFRALVHYLISLPGDPQLALCHYQSFLLLRHSPLRSCRHKKRIEAGLDCKKLEAYWCHFFFFPRSQLCNVSDPAQRNTLFLQSLHHLAFRLLLDIISPLSCSEALPPRWFWLWKPLNQKTPNGSWQFY